MPDLFGSYLLTAELWVFALFLLHIWYFRTASWGSAIESLPPSSAKPINGTMSASSKDSRLCLAFNGRSNGLRTRSAVSSWWRKALFLPEPTDTEERAQRDAEMDAKTEAVHNDLQRDLDRLMQTIDEKEITVVPKAKT